MTWLSREVHLTRHSEGVLTPDHFTLASVEIDDPVDGKFVVQNEYLALDPYLRIAMTPTQDRRRMLRLGRAVPALAVGRVVASENNAFPPGAVVTGHLGWREFASTDGRGIRVIDVGDLPISYALNPLGMPGQTAWAGMRIGSPRENETVYVSAAAGAVGSIAGQLAALRGARVVGSAGSNDKVEWLTKIGFAAAFNHREMSVAEGLAVVAPHGVDLFFDNVGGSTLEAAIDAMNEHGRILSSGAIELYNDRDAARGPRNLDLLSQKALRIIGFRYSDVEDERPVFQGELTALLASGDLKVAEFIVDGIENTAEAFLSVFSSSQLGKPLIRVVVEK
jgi:NADPH-dependent curcumin reductase CurA